MQPSQQSPYGNAHVPQLPQPYGANPQSSVVAKLPEASQSPSPQSGVPQQQSVYGLPRPALSYAPQSPQNFQPTQQSQNISPQVSQQQYFQSQPQYVASSAGGGQYGSIAQQQFLPTTHLQSPIQQQSNTQPPPLTTSKPQQFPSPPPHPTGGGGYGITAGYPSRPVATDNNLVSPGGLAGYPPAINSYPSPHQHPVPNVPPPQMAMARPMAPPAPFAAMRPAAPVATAPPKISAAQMPNVVAVQEADAARYSDPDALFRSSLVEDLLPPLPSTEVPILDDGNCGPLFMRSTLYHVPISEELAQSTKIPLAIVMQPFAKPHIRQAGVPVVEFGETGILRCTRCRAYINLFVKFLRGGRAFECNICTMINDVPDEYFCNLDATGRRTDLCQRPELMHGSVDFVASKEYVMRPPEAPYLLFAVDASRAAIQNGSFASALNSIRAVFESHIQTSPEERMYARMAIITFDKSINVYDLRATEPQILVMSDIHEPFVPLHDGLFFKPEEAYEQLFALLDRLPTLFNETRTVDSCLGAASTFALDALKSHGGRAVIFHTTLPNVGIGLLRNRDSSSTSAADKPNTLLLPQGDFYTKLGKQAASFGVSYVLVSTPSAYTDLATIGQLATTTSGHILHYSKFGSDYAGRTMVEDVHRFLLKPFVFDAILRVRAGSALQTSEYYGNCATLNQTDYQFAAFDCDQTLAVTFMYDSKLPEGERVSFQCAILHTTSDGRRRIRVHNLALNVSSAIANIFRMADLDALLQFYCKRAVSQISQHSLATLINHIHIRSAQVLGSYRKFCANAMPSGQLVLPESLKLLPIFCLALNKSTAFSTGSLPIDMRAAALFNLMSMSLAFLPVYLYPRLFPLHRLLDEQHDLKLPPPQLRLSQEFLEPHGLYLLENGFRLLLWVGNMIDPEILSRLFGVAQLSAIAAGPEYNLPELNNTLSIKVRQLVSNLQSKHHRYLPLHVIRQGLDPAEVDWQSNLIEDGQNTLGPSYVDFLCRLHNQINHEINTASLAEKTALLSFLQ